MPSATTTPPRGRLDLPTIVQPPSPPTVRPPFAASRTSSVFLQTSGQSVPDGLFAPDLFADLTFPGGGSRSRVARTLVEAEPADCTRSRARCGWRRSSPPPADGRSRSRSAGRTAGQQWYCREAFSAGLDGLGRSPTSALYCTGDWDEARVAEHARAVTLLRTSPAPGRRATIEGHGDRRGRRRGSAAALDLAGGRLFGADPGRTPAVLHEAYERAVDERTRARLRGCPGTVLGLRGRALPRRPFAARRCVTPTPTATPWSGRTRWTRPWPPTGNPTSWTYAASSPTRLGDVAASCWSRTRAPRPTSGCSRSPPRPLDMAGMNRHVGRSSCWARSPRRPGSTPRPGD